MRILGIDPGLATVGYAVIDAKDRECKLLEYGCIRTSPDQHLPARLEIIFQAVTELIDEFSPEEMSVEELFFSKNVTNGLLVGQARGVVVLAAKLRGLSLYEYKPMQVKQAVTGYGRADKRQMQENIRMIFRLRELPKPDDAADAVGIAFTHAMSHRFKEQYQMK